MLFRRGVIVTDVPYHLAAKGSRGPTARGTGQSVGNSHAVAPEPRDSSIG